MHWILQWLQSWVRDSHCPILKHILKIATVLSSPAVGSGSESQNNPCWKGPLQVIWGQPLSCLGHICSGPHPVKIWGSPRLKNLQTLGNCSTAALPSEWEKKILITKSFYHCDLCLLPLVLCSSQKNLAPRLYMGSFLLLPISPPNTLTFSILRQTNPSPKELSQDDQVHPCYHPPSWFSVFPHCSHSHFTTLITEAFKFTPKEPSLFFFFNQDKQSAVDRTVPYNWTSFPGVNTRDEAFG